MVIRNSSSEFASKMIIEDKIIHIAANRLGNLCVRNFFGALLEVEEMLFFSC